MSQIIQQGLVHVYFTEHIIYIVIGIILSAVIGYLLGSLNFALVLSKVLYKDDIRKHGSGGAGLTNMQRTYGNKAAIGVLVGDVLKTVVAVIIGSLLLGGAISDGFIGGYIGGVASVIGHCFPVYYRFRGGKGVLSAATLVLVTSPVIFALCMILFVAIVLATKYVSLGSIFAVLVYPLLLANLTGHGPHVLFAIFIALLVVFLHRANVKRLINGEESKLNLRKKSKDKDKTSYKSSKDNTSKTDK